MKRYVPWVERLRPGWWPDGLCVNSPRVWVIVGSVALGFAVSWWLNKPVPPWIKFEAIQATYERGSKVVHVTGEYTAAKTCSRKEQETEPGAPEPLVWRQEVRGTGPEVIQYAPTPRSPSLEIGEHQFATEIPLTAGIEPDGWTVAVIVSCDTEPYAVRSRSVRVRYLPRREIVAPPS